MPSPPNKQTKTVNQLMLILPDALLEYEFDCSISTKEKIYVLFALLKFSDHILRENGTIVDGVVRDILGSNWKTIYVKLVDSRLNPMDLELWQNHSDYYFVSTAINKKIDKIEKLLCISAKIMKRLTNLSQLCLDLKARREWIT